MNMMKKIVALVIALTVSVWLIGPGVAQAVTVADLQAQIDALLATLADLQAQLAVLQAGEGVAVSCTFTRSLYPGISGADVKCLQQYLNGAGYTLAASGAGSPGNETQYFGPLTQAAVKKWQDANGIAYGAWGGYFGPLSRAKYDQLVVAPPPEEEEEEVPTVAAGLAVGLATDTPAAATVAAGANANFTKFTLTAGSEGDVKISKIYVTRSGLTANSDLENIKIVEADTGVHRGSIGSLNVNSKAMITFTPSLKIEAGTSESFFIRAGFVSGATAGKTAVLGITSADDIVSNASEVTGLPVTGNTMTVVSLTIGSATVAEDGTTIDTTPDVGDTDVTVNQFKVTAGSTEAITIEQITAIKAGTSDNSDTANVELYSVTDSKSLGTVASWDAESKASWSNLNIVVGKGATHRFKIMVDIVDGPSLTVNADIVDGSDTLMTVKGNTYGFYITASEGTWNGKGTNNQTINTGALNVSKSASTPATGNISAGDAIKLAVFDFDAKGEEVKITQVIVEATLGTMVYTEVTNVAIYDKDGIVAGPSDLGSGSSVTFTDTFIVPVGIHPYTVKAKIADAVSTSDTILIDLDRPGTSITATGMTSNSSITPTPATDVSANTQTVAAGALTATTLTQPVARSVAAGINDFVWMTASLSAGTSGEDVQVTALVIEDTLGDAADDSSTIDNAEIWADLTDGSSARGDIYETKVSTTEQPDDTGATDETHSFTLTQTITVPKGTFIKIAFVADLAAGATAGDTHTISLDTDAGDVTANGATTGTSITVTPTGAGQTMTVAAGGTLTLTKDASSPVTDIVIGGKTVTLGVFRLAANNVEDLDLDSVYFSVTNGTYVDTYYFYHGDTLLQTAASSTTPYVAFSDGTLTIPANGNVKFTVKAKIQSMANLTNNTTITVNTSATYKIDTTGLSSGTAVDSTAAVSSNGMDAYETRPYFALNAASPSGTLNPSSGQLVAIFNVTAENTEDVTFEASTGGLVVNISSTQADSDGTATAFTLKDGEGNTLDTATAADGATSVTFDFASSAFTVPAGQTKQLRIEANLTDWEDNGDTFRLWLDDDTATNVDWSIDNNAASYYDADKIFRGDIYGGTFVNPT